MRFDDANRVAAIAYFERLGVDIREALARNELDRADGWVEALLAREKVSGDLDVASRAKLQQGVLRAGRDVTEAMRKRYEGDFVHLPIDPLLALADAPSANSEALIVPSSQAPVVTGGPLFSERAELYRLKRLRLGTWDPQTALQARKTYALFHEVCGDRPIGGYVRADAVRFKDMLVELPASYGKAAQYRGLILADIVQAVRLQAVRLLSPRTVQRHLSALACLWDDAVEAGEASSQIFGNFKLPTAKRAKDQRDMWTTPQLKQLVDTPVWRGCFSQARRSKPGKLVIRDDKFWLPLIALYSGMRQEEICQLHLEDLRLEGDVWVFDVNDNPPRQLKNRNATRLVPVHRALLDLGLVDYANALRLRGEARLFPLLQAGGADGRLGHNFTKWFTRYRRDVGLYQPQLDFHSLRHSATTFLHHADVEPVLIDALTGHETAGETARYTKYFRVEQLKLAIDKLDPGICLGHLLPQSSVKTPA